jgi:hypothetical protein
MDQVGDSFGFQCASCGEYHVGIPGFGWDWPMQYFAVPESERDARVDLASDQCIIDDKWFFVRGCLEIPVIGFDEPMVWGAWVMLSEKNFGHYAAQFGLVERPGGDRFEGLLCSWFRVYPDPGPTPLSVTLLTRPWPTRPYIELESTDFLLSVEQREGITRERVQQIAEEMMHPRKNRDRTD